MCDARGEESHLNSRPWFKLGKKESERTNEVRDSEKVVLTREDWNNGWNELQR